MFPALNQDQDDTAQDERDRHDCFAVEKGLDEIIQQQAQYGGGKKRQRRLLPEGHRVSIQLAFPDGPELPPEIQAYRKNGGKLDDDDEGLVEGLVIAQAEKRFREDEVPGAADGQKFGDPLHHRQNESIYEIHQELPGLKGWAATTRKA